MGSTTVQAAPPRDYAQETRDTLANQIQLAPQLYASEAQYQPLYTQLALQNAQTSLLGGNGQMGLIDLYSRINPQLSQISAASNTAQRTADIQDVEGLGSRASQAFLNANPELKAQLDRATSMQNQGPGSGQTMLEQQLQSGVNFANLQADRLSAQQLANPTALQANQITATPVNPYDAIRVDGGPAINAMMVNNPSIRAGEIQGGQLQDRLTQQAMDAGPSVISQRLQQQALDAINQGGQLSEQEMRDATQATRSAYAARGMGLGDQAALGEVQNRLINQRQRQLENLSLAGNINSQLLGEQAQNRGFAQGVLGQNVAIQGQNIGNALAAAQANQGASMQAQLANQGANLQAQSLTRDLSLRAQLANQAAQNAAFQQAQQINAQQGMQAQLANQSANLQAGQFNVDALLRAQQANQAANLQADQANVANFLNANQFNTQFNQGARQQYLQNLGQLAQLQGQNTAADRSFAAQLVGLRQATASDPFQAVLGRPSAAFAQAQGMQNQGVGLQQLAGPALFNPESSYANNIYGGNQQSQNAANIASAQASAAKFAGLMQGLGSIGGGWAGAGFPTPGCWVAREVYGETNPKWRRFRTWLATRAPSWFQKLYNKFGPNFALWISDKPRVKAVIRRWMDARVATLGKA
jgi:hypothetical protein